MSSSLILSAMAIVALTATTLTTLKYYPAHESDADDLNLIEDDYGDDANATFYYHHSPKFPHNKNVNRQNDLPIFTDKPHVVVKRSSDEESTAVQYSIDDKNSSMIDEAKRDKVKEVARLNNVYTSVAAAITCQYQIKTSVFFIVSL